MSQLSPEFVLWIVLSTLIALVCVIFLGLVRLAQRLGRTEEHVHHADPRFPDRAPLSLDEFYEQYYRAHEFPRALVLEVLTQFAAAVRVPASVMRPQDSFASLASVVQGDTEACERLAVETASAIHEAEVKYGANLFSGRLNTLDDYIRTTVLAHRLMSGK